MQKNTKKIYKKDTWSAEKRGYERNFLGIVGRPTKVLDIESAMAGEIGYTSSKGTIHLAYDHPIMDGLSDIEKVSFRKGVFAHETLHQVFTNFSYYEKKLQTYKVAEREIFSTFNNILEDAAIENFAPEVMGGTLLTSLRFQIAHIYKWKKPLNDSPDAFSQYIDAFIQFGDMGLLKGEFTFPEAKDMFFKTAQLFSDGIDETDGRKRIDIAIQIMEIARPLWEDYAKNIEKMQEFMKKLQEMGKSQMQGKGKGQQADGSGSDDSKASKRRKLTIRKVSKEKYEEMKKNGELPENSGSSGELPDGDIEAIMCEDAENEGNSGGSGMSIPGAGSNSDGEENSGGSSGGLDDFDVEVIDETDGSSNKKDKKEKKDEDEDGDENDDGTGNGTDAESTDEKESEDGKESKNGKNGEKGKKDKGKESGKKGKDQKSNDSNQKEQEQSDSHSDTFYTPPQKDVKKVKNRPTPEGFEEAEEENGIGEITEEEYQLSDTEITRIENELERVKAEYEKEEAMEAKETPLENFPITAPKLGKRTCLNYRVTYNDSDKMSLEDSYQKVITSLNPGIKALTTQLRRIFENDFEEREYRNTGKLNMKRYHSGRVTARVFDKRVTPSELSNLCVEILVDESGSMSGRNKDVSARHSCIALAEVFNNLGIPCYIIGFTADTQRHDIVHNHYITWKNTHNERLKLLNICARCNNCDGYSIRYATEILKKAKSQHKLLIVLSDGQPAASGYHDGIADTKQAIRDAKKHHSVLGVAIGNSDTEEIHYMYEKDFLLVSHVDDLFAGLSKQIQKLVKSWM